MLFMKKKKAETEEANDVHTVALQQLQHLCGKGRIFDNAFVIEEEDLCIYADVVSTAHNVAQIVFQLHHAWLEDPIMESIAASGSDPIEAVQLACEDFYRNIMCIYQKAFYEEGEERIVGMTQFRHDFRIYKNQVHGMGKREGIMKQDFWEMLKQDLTLRLGNKKVYWIKVFTSKNSSDVVCEVRINGREDHELSKQLLPYAQSWNSIGNYHTEKQNILLVQEESSFLPSDFTREDICQYTRKAIKWFEKCTSKEDYRKIREQLISTCRDDSLAYEIFSFIPEIYCKYVYSQAEYGSRLYLIQKGKKTKELYQSQLQSYSYVEETVMEHLKKENVDKRAIENVLCYSVHARAIQKAVAQGSAIEELIIPGIGYYVENEYNLR